MKIGDIVECISYGAAIVLGPCQIPTGVPEEALELFLSNPEKSGSPVAQSSRHFLFISPLSLR